AARITGRFAVLTTGMLGGVLWLYQQTLSDQRKALIKTEEKLNDDAKKLMSTVEEYRVVAEDSIEKLGDSENTLKKAVDALCKGDPKCAEQYKVSVKSGRRA